MPCWHVQQSDRCFVVLNRAPALHVRPHGACALSDASPHKGGHAMPDVDGLLDGRLATGVACPGGCVRRTPRRAGCLRQRTAQARCPHACWA